VSCVWTIALIRNTGIIKIEDSKGGNISSLDLTETGVYDVSLPPHLPTALINMISYILWKEGPAPYLSLRGDYLLHNYIKWSTSVLMVNVT
jgi:hypothetical protein